MNKTVIAIEQDKVDLETKTLYKLVGIINNYTEELNNNNYNLTTDDVKQMAHNHKEFNKKVYLEELEKICDTFALDFSEVSKWEYTLTNSEMFSNMANKKAQYIYELSKEIHKCCYLNEHCIEYLEIKDNMCTPVLDCEENITEYYTHYTANEKQDNLTEHLKNIQAEIESLVKDGYTVFNIKSFIDNRNILNYKQIERL